MHFEIYPRADGWQRLQEKPRGSCRGADREEALPVVRRGRSLSQQIMSQQVTSQQSETMRTGRAACTSKYVTLTYRFVVAGTILIATIDAAVQG